MVHRSRVLAVVFVFLATAGVAMAQTGATATVRGQVRDPQGRAVSGAKVAVTSAATGLVRQAPADETGAFALTDLAPGDVTITVTAPNFAEQRYTDVVLRVGQTLDLQVALSVAGVNESVTVAGTSVGIVDTTRSVVDAVIALAGHRQAAAQRPQLPRAGAARPRQRAGAELRPDQDAAPCSISSAGQFGRGGNITIDGTDNNDDVVGGPLHERHAGQRCRNSRSPRTASRRSSAARPDRSSTSSPRSGSDQLHGSASTSSRDDALAGAAGDLRPERRRRPPVRSPAARGVGRRPDREGHAVLVRRDRVPQPGRRRAGRHARRRRAHDPAVVRRGAARRPARHRRASTGARAPTTADAPLRRRERATTPAPATLDRAIGSASQRQRSQNRYNAVVGTWTRICLAAHRERA